MKYLSLEILGYTARIVSLTVCRVSSPTKLVGLHYSPNPAR